MKMRSAILTGVTGLMLSAGLGTSVEAQSVYRYRDNAMVGRYGYANPQRQARQIVRQAYRDVLRREPDASGLREYMDAMINRGWSEADVRRSLQQSDEYAQRFGSYRYGSSRYGWRGYR